MRKRRFMGFLDVVGKVIECDRMFEKSTSIPPPNSTLRCSSPIGTVRDEISRISGLPSIEYSEDVQKTGFKGRTFIAADERAWLARKDCGDTARRLCGYARKSL